MSRISFVAQMSARAPEAATFKARVPTGSLSHLSGKRFAAPRSCEREFDVRRRGRWGAYTMDDYLWSSSVSRAVGSATKECAYLTSSRILSTSTAEPRSSFKTEGGAARVRPVPTTSQPARSKTLTTCLPSRPVAPVMSTFFDMLMRWVGDGC